MAIHNSAQQHIDHTYGRLNSSYFLLTSISMLAASVLVHSAVTRVQVGAAAVVAALLVVVVLPVVAD
jgi:hypothetical protein